jgi:hypothetical protein
MTLALHLGYEILGRIGSASYSINAVLEPLLLGALCFFAALVWRARNRPRLALVLLTAAGLWFGLAVMIRLPVMFLLPGLALLLWHESWRASLRNALVFGLGVFVSGLLPVLASQRRVAGAWYLPTYGGNDSAAPSLTPLAGNFAFYFNGGPGSVENWAWWLMALGALGFALARPRTLAGLSWRRLFISALCVWGLPTAYFLTHPVAIHYYTVPATFVAVLSLACGALALETCGLAARPATEKRPLLWLGLLLVFMPGVTVLDQARRQRPRTLAVNETPPRAVAVPDELRDERAWVWAGELNGTLWYYAGVPGYKLFWASPQVRALVYRFVHERGERQYLVNDSAAWRPFMEEIKAWGGTLEARGQVDTHPYFLIRWPPEGPPQ